MVILYLFFLLFIGCISSFFWSFIFSVFFFSFHHQYYIIKNKSLHFWSIHLNHYFMFLFTVYHWIWVSSLLIFSIIVPFIFQWFQYGSPQLSILIYFNIADFSLLLIFLFVIDFLIHPKLSPSMIQKWWWYQRRKRKLCYHCKF